jgi:hypothetical protein
MTKHSKVENHVYSVGQEFISESEYHVRMQRERNKKDNIRTTFKIPASLFAKFNKVAKGYKLIDLFEDLAELLQFEGFIEIIVSQEKANSMNKEVLDSPRKSFLLSKLASTTLTQVSKKSPMSRDLVVSQLFAMWIGQHERQQIKQRKAYEEVQDKFGDAISALEEMEEIFKDKLPHNDPYVADIGFSLQTLYNADMAVQQYFETGVYTNDLSL